jgi:predicted pyridoxine 5'-phosphate oxidase superfamily flavin-nucleotide-binding protein
MNALAQKSISPFHPGEQQAQSRAGTRERTEMIGQRAIRSFMPDQHRDFFGQLSFVVLGSVDPDGWPWASIVSGQPGFTTSSTPTSLEINAQPVQHDPLGTSLIIGTPIGVLGIELANRRRNRVNAKVAGVASDRIALEVQQSFGNCPQYIQTHDLRFARAPDTPIELRSDTFATLDDAARTLISTANTFYVSSYVTAETDTATEGVDVSHRGGQSGFVSVAENTLTIPDYAGNNFFNTIGNFIANPKAGLLFTDVTTGDVLMLTGRVDLLWDDHPKVQAIPGAERAWRFTLDHGVRIYDALPFRAELTECSPYCPKIDA